MIWPPPIAALLSLIAALISAAIASYAWHRRATTAARQLAAIMLAVTAWAVGYALELASPSLGAKLFWTGFQYLGIACLPALWMLFVLAYGGYGRWQQGWGAALWFVIPALTLALNWTNAAHLLYYREVSLDHTGLAPMLIITPGPWYWVQIGYTYLAVTLGMGLLWGRARHTAQIYQRQTAVILAGVSVPWLASLSYVSYLNPLAPLDPTPFAFVITGIVIAWGLFRYRLCTLVPMARDRVLEHMRDVVLVLDADHVVVDLNLAAQRLFAELTPSALGQPAALLLAEWPALVRACRQPGEARLELTWERPARRWFDVQVSPLADQAGRLSGRLLIWRDITERHQAEALLQRRFHFIELIQRAANDFIRVGVEQIDEQITAVLRAVAELFSVERGYIFMIVPERGIIELSHEWCAPDVLPHHGVLDSVAIADFADFLHRMRRGEIASVQARDIQPTPDNQAMNEVLGLLQIKSFVNIPLFISDQLIGWIGFDAVVHENEWSDETIEAFLLAGQLIASAVHRRQSAEALRTSEQRFHSLFNHMIEGVALHRVIYDDAGQVVNYEILDVNTQYERILNMGREDVCHKLASEAYGTPTPPYLEEFTSVGRSGQPSQFETYFAPMGKHFSISVSPLGTDHFATIFSDITERKQAEQEQARLQAQLLQSQKMEAIGLLAGGIAHDFNNILTVISGNTDLALFELPSYHPAYADLQAIQQSAARAAQLVRQLLTFARRQASQPEIVDLNALVMGVTPMLRRLIGEHIQLDFLPEPALARARIDPHQFEQVLINLAVNARDAMPRGGTLTIATANADMAADDAGRDPEVAPGPYVSLMVRDTGEGMTDEVREHIFEPYYTTKAVGRGTGLGLATCLGIIKQHQGLLFVKSAAGRGSCFSVYLPATAEVTSPSERLEPEAENKGGSETVLVVEDEQEVRQLAARILRTHGYTVLAAANGQEAQQISATMAGQPIHLLLTDLIMPRPGGLELAQHLLAQRPDLRVLIMSGYAEYRSSPDANGLTDLPFLQKPFSQATLLQQVRRALL